MIVTKMQYLEPVYRGRTRGENYEYVHVAAHQIKPDERLKLEEIARKWTYFFLDFSVTTSIVKMARTAVIEAFKIK